MHGYITVEPLYISLVEHSVIGTNHCTGAYLVALVKPGACLVS